MAQLNIFCFLSTYTTEHITLQKTHLRSPTIKSLGWIDKFTRARHPYYTYNILQWPFVPVCYFKSNFCDQRPPQFAVVTGHNIWDIKERLFSDRGRHSSLWPRATTRGKLQNWDNMIINNTKSSVTCCIHIYRVIARWPYCLDLLF